MSRPANISRRRFIFLAGAVTAGAGLNACTPRITARTAATPTPIPTQPVLQLSKTPTMAQLSPEPTATPTPSLRLDGGNADIWAWETAARGQTQNLACEKIQMQANDTAVDAEIEKDRFQASIPVQPGDNKVSAACLPAGITAPPLTYTGMLRNVPTAVIEIRIENGRVLLDGSTSQLAPLDAAPISEYIWSGEIVEGGEVRSKSLDITPPQADGEYFLTLKVIDEAGRADASTTYFVVKNGQPLLDDWSWQNARWIENAVVYGVIPRKFGSQGFRSIQDRLDALRELGVTALWLAPVNQTPPGDYGYRVTDYFTLRPQYGTEEDFRALVQAAHERGIRVLMDFVPNHSSDQHRYFQDAQQYGPTSHYWTYYDRDEAGQPTHYFHWTYLPNLNYNNPEVANWMIEAFSYWVREFDVDGFRVDAAWGIRQRTPDFWPRWRAALKRIKPDLLLLAEASARDGYYFTQGFDAAYDWTDQLGKWAWERVFEDDKLLIYNLDSELTNHREGYHEDALIFRFLNNNDTSARFLTRYGLEMTRVATVLLLTLPGIPCIYTGDEVGAEYTPYGDPQPLDWQERHGLFAFHQQLIALRRDTPSLHARGWQIVDIEPHTQVFAYLRYTRPEDADPALVVLNFSGQPAEALLDLPAPFDGWLRRPGLRDLLTGEAVKPGAKNDIQLPPYSARIIAA